MLGCSTLQAALRRKTGTPMDPDQHRVVFDGRRLYTSHTLVSCGIQDGNTVYIHSEQIGD